jgi:peptidoglycan/xylan/chitin deacetylase (PgdA/CDA1 family)
VTFAEAVRGEYEGKVVAVTFDDGYRSVLEVAKPILDAHGMPATVFLVTDYVGSERSMSWEGIDRWLDGRHADELMPMSWAEARQLVDEGWEIGSHTRTHPKLTEVDDARLREELEGSRAECERQLERPCETVAYPYGDLDLRVEEAAMRAGYAAGAALTPRFGRPPAFCRPRTGIYQIDGQRSFGIKTSRTVRRIQRTRSWSMIGGIAHALRKHEPDVE